MIKDNVWYIDIENRCVRHANGLCFTFEGEPDKPTSVIPKRFPSQLSASAQAQLLRHGIEAVAQCSARVSACKCA